MSKTVKALIESLGDKVCDGDFHTKSETIPYSLSPRELFTADDMVKLSIRKGDFL